jgi:SAM-dependent methyltransferase
MFNQCYLCGSNQIIPLSGYERNFLYKCGSCSFVFCNKIPSKIELEAHYFDYPRENAISPITVKRYQLLLDEFERYRLTGNLIDVGCGDGFFLVEAKKRNWNVFGTEFTDQAISNCRSKAIEMTRSPLNPENYPPDFFDVVTSFEVFEHINTPKQELSSFNKILRTGGLLYLTTPNFNSVSRIILRGKWSVIEYPEHLAYYTVKTLGHVTRLLNFRKLRISTTGISISRLAKGSGINSISLDERLRVRIEKRGFLALLKTLINAALNLSQTGDAMKGFFVKDGNERKTSGVLGK